MKHQFAQVEQSLRSPWDFTLLHHTEVGDRDEHGSTFPANDVILCALIALCGPRITESWRSAGGYGTQCFQWIPGVSYRHAAQLLPSNRLAAASH